MIFRHPTLAGLAATLRTSEVVVANQDVVPIRADGHEHPLFLLHEVSGQVLYGFELVKYLAEDVPVFGLIDAASNDAASWTIHGAAERHVASIRDIQPSGPYRVAGWSFGGMLAYEIAAQLIDMGEKIEFLGLIDTYRFPFRKHAQDGRTLRLENDIDYLSDIIYHETLLSPPQYSTFETLVRKCQMLNLLPHFVDEREAMNYVTLQRIRTAAADHYPARRLSIPVHLFVAEDDPTDFPFRNWDSVLSSDQISTIPVPGNHQSIMNSPLIKRLGAAISTSLRSPKL
jgi:thioesterase domain-containing protein